MLQYLKANSTGGYSHTSNADKPGSRIVKGVHRDYTPEFVKERLEELCDFKIKEVRSFQKSLAENEKPLHWWIVTTEKRGRAESQEDSILRTSLRQMGAPGINNSGPMLQMPEI